MKQFFTGLIIGLSVMFLIAAVGKGPNMENGGYDGGEIYAGHFPKYMPPYWIVGYMHGFVHAHDIIDKEVKSEDKAAAIEIAEQVLSGAKYQKIGDIGGNRIDGNIPAFLGPVTKGGFSQCINEMKALKK